MKFIKLHGMGSVIFGEDDAITNYDESISTDLKRIKGFVIKQRCGVAGNFDIGDVKEVIFTVSADGKTATTDITVDEYKNVPDVGDYIWLRLKDTDNTIQKLQIISASDDASEETRTLTVGNVDDIFGEADASEESFMIVLGENGVPEVIEIDNIDTTVNIFNIQHVSDDTE
jgi:hypothetical protein